MRPSSAARHGDLAGVSQGGRARPSRPARPARLMSAVRWRRRSAPAARLSPRIPAQSAGSQGAGSRTETCSAGLHPARCWPPVDRIHPILLVDGLPSDDGPSAVTVLEEIVETPGADNVNLHVMNHGALVDGHLRLRDGAVAVHVDGAAAQEMQNPDAGFEALPADRDEVARAALKPGGRHIAVRMPYLSESIPLAGIPPDDPPLDDLTNFQLAGHLVHRITFPAIGRPAGQGRPERRVAVLRTTSPLAAWPGMSGPPGRERNVAAVDSPATPEAVSNRRLGGVR